MVDDLDGLFVIDKKGNNEPTPPHILYTEAQASEETSNKTPEPQQASRPRRAVTGKRYHEADDYSKFRPGVLSKELREALSIGPNEVPIHIYRMRTLGYPPGWLRKARVGGELTIFDSVTAFTEDPEVTYNRDALVSYPGFNTYLDYPAVDDFVYLNCPPMQSHHMLDNFYAALSRSCHNALSQTPSDLAKLRAERERILAEIRQLDARLSTSKSNGTNGNTESGKSERLEVAGVSDAEKSHLSVKPPEGSGDNNSMPDSSESETSRSEVFQISATEDGTPTPMRPFIITDESDGESSTSAVNASLDKRPSIDAFTIGIQPFRPFENLPGSQGAYQRVRETLKNSRTESSVLGLSDTASDVNSPVVGVSVKSSTPDLAHQPHQRNADNGGDTGSSRHSHQRYSFHSYHSSPSYPYSRSGQRRY
ncbi:unnamed protein product [Calicophoron daubneyi]|uniref:PSP proline-rich domain-containing protein n=1 Tax=Calicophoron daubneyi TaxID=300641 RepID=A0AAV2TQK7_CALDB